jgi:hypothetical protein
MKINRKQQQNSRAFSRIISEYIARKCKTQVSIIDPSIEVKGKTNPETPTNSDFFCECELSWEREINDPYLLSRFIATYLLDEKELTDGEQRSLEQKIGRVFIKKGLYPPESYFKVNKK